MYFFPTSVMARHRLLKRIGRLLVAAFYPSETWLQPRTPDRTRRSNWRRYSKHELPGPAFDLTLLLLCAIAAVASLLV